MSSYRTHGGTKHGGTKRALFVLGAASLCVILLSSVALAAGQDLTEQTYKVPTKAKVVAGALAPVIECKWELPDMQSSVAGIQYDVAAATHTHDFDMTVGPSVNPACDSKNGIDSPTMPNNVQHMTQVLPNADDKPEERRVELWMAVDHPAGIDAIDDVYWKIFHPDGTFKIQVHGVKQPCGSLGTSTGGMFEAAYHTGQVSARGIDDINFGMIAKCQEHEKAIYRAEFSVSKEQPCGQYRVEAHAVSAGAEANVLTNYIDVFCFFKLEADFTQADWGLVIPGRTDVLSGDLLLTSPNNPTLENTGNTGMGVGVLFSEMLQVDANGVPLPGAKKISVFDAAFGIRPDVLQVINPIQAGVRADFNGLRNHVLCSNELGKLDLSIHPAQTIPSGDYKGDLTIYARAVRQVCPTDQENLIPNPNA